MQTRLDDKMKAEDILKLPSSLWAKIGGKVATKIVKDSDKGFGTSETGKRYKFKGYTSKYATNKSTQFKIVGANAWFYISTKANECGCGYCIPGWLKS